MARDGTRSPAWRKIAREKPNPGGAKQLTSPADFRQIRGNPALGQQSYWLELVDLQHRPGYWLSEKYEVWLNLPRVLLAQPLNKPKEYTDFWTWVGNVAPAGQVQMLDEVGRARYEVTLGADGLLLDYLGQPASTRTMSTAASGSGWAIFVLSQGGQLYMNSHDVGIFHHSSFLSGAAAAAAGEICVDDDGRVAVITNKTGHYRAGTEEMLRMVTRLPVSLLTLIMPDYHRAEAGPSPRVARYYFATMFRAFSAAGTTLPPLKRSAVEPRVPAWARVTGRPKAFLARIPDQT